MTTHTITVDLAEYNRLERNQYHAMYRREHRDQIKNNQRRYYIKHADAIRQRRRAHYKQTKLNPTEEVDEYNSGFTTQETAVPPLHQE
jgi:hypothetical protein